jgi:hypothetical protein
MRGRRFACSGWSSAAPETLAARHARRELTALVQRAPKHAQVRTAEGIREVEVEALRIGVVVVRTGDVVAVDGTTWASPVPSTDTPCSSAAGRCSASRRAVTS